MKLKELRLKDCPDKKTYLINTAKICPYCDKEPKYVDSKVIYNGVSYGMIYLCEDCDAYCGVHNRNSKVSLGRLANAELRRWKKDAHGHLDVLWRDKMKRDEVPKHIARTAAYKWVSEKLGIPLPLCHIGMFNVVDCKRLITLCKPYIHEKV